jgi:hypothetical protein
MNDDFLDLIRLMNQHRVDFILVGGYAYIFNAEARYTGDIDFWVRPTQENLERLNDATEAFIGARFEVDEVLALLETPRLGFKLVGEKPNQIEILLRVSGLEFEAAKQNARKSEDSELSFLVLHPHDQIRNKRASDREKDRLDVKTLVKLHGEPES